MRRHPACLLGLAVLSTSLGLAIAQTPADLEEMRFINALRQRGDNDLARAYLERLRKNPPPGLVGELPLEIAKTRIAEASEEPDSGKRMAIYLEARAEFEQFLAKNPKHPRSGDAKLEIAHVAVMQGKAALAKAQSQESKQSRDAESATARGALEDAGKRLREVTRELDRDAEGLPEPKTPADKEQRRKADEERQRAHLGIALNLFDQSQTYPTEGVPPKAYYDLLLGAQKELGTLAAGEQNSSVTWTAKAWLGRCLHAAGDNKASEKIAEVVENARNPAAAEGYRLARYFRLLILKEDQKLKDKNATLEDIAKRWITEYPRFKNTPEGSGIRYELAQLHLAKAGGIPATQKQARDGELTKARALLREVESSENEFTDRARRDKLRIMKLQGSFDNKVESLKTFEDLYVRAQYEISLINEETKDKPADQAEKIRNARIANILQALQRGLALPEVKGKKTPEIGNAQAIQAYYNLNTKHYRDAIKVGEKFAREDTVSAQAATVATYALQAYSQSIADREAMLQGTTGDLMDENGKKVSMEQFQRDLKADHEKMTDFARHVQRCWPRDTAGDLARHQLALLLLRDKDESARTKNIQEAIKSLAGIQPSYPSHVFTMYLLAENAFEADKQKLPPIKEEGKPELSYHQRAMAALESVKEPVTGDPSANLIFYLGRCKLGEEYYKEKKFAQMEQLAEPLLPKIADDRTKLSDNAAKNGEFKTNVQTRLANIVLFAKYGQADAAFTAGDLAKVATLLDPLVDQIKAGKDNVMKNNVQLGQVVLGMALRANIQLGKLDRTGVVVEALQQVSGDDGADNATTILRNLIALIVKQLEELNAKGDKAALAKAKQGFVTILKQLSSKAKFTPQYVGPLADAYSRLEMPAMAIELLTKLPPPKKGNADEEKAYRPIQLMLVRQYRLNKELKKARPLLEEIIGTKEKPGWGLRSIEPLKEQIYLLADEEKYAEGFTKASALAKQMLPKIDTDPAIKGHYLDCYYEMVYCMYKFGLGQKDSTKKEKTINDAAKLLDQLEKKYPDFGGDTMAKKIKELLAKEADLKTALDKIKKAQPAG